MIFLIIVWCLVLLTGGGWWFFLTVGEYGDPIIEIGADAAFIGRQKAINVTFADSGRGLRRTEIVITQDNRPRVLSAIDYPEAGVRSKAVSVVVDASALKLHDGPATLTLTALDQINSIPATRSHWPGNPLTRPTLRCRSTHRRAARRSASWPGIRPETKR